MSEIKDKVYLNGQWIDDYYLTSEKNQELKDLRKDLTNESQTREENDSKLNSNVQAVRSEVNTRLNAAVTDVRQEVEQSINNVTTLITNESNRAKEQEGKLDQSIKDEKDRATGREQEIEGSLNSLSENITSSYETKADAESKRSTLDGKIDTTRSNLESKIETDIKAAIDNITELNGGAVDTLKEIADWIVNDESGAAKMLSDISDLQQYDKTQDGRLETIEDSIKNLTPESGSMTDLVNDVKKAKEDITGLTSSLSTETNDRKAKDTELENKFNSYVTTESLQSNYTNTTDLNSKLDGYVKKEAGKQLSTNDYTTEEKDKLTLLDASLYERSANRKANLDSADDNTYPTTKAVKTYIDDKTKNIPDVDASKLVLKEGDPQVVSATTTFNNLFVNDVKLDSNDTGLVVSSENGELKDLTAGDITSNNLVTSSIDAQDRNGVSIKVKDFTYVFENDPSAVKTAISYTPYNSSWNNAVIPNRTLVTADYLFSQLATVKSDNASDILYVSYICTTKADADSVLVKLDIDDKVLVIENNIPVIYVVAEQEDAQQLVQDNSAVQLIYSDKFVESQVERIEFRIYGFIVKSTGDETSEVELNLIYPTNIRKLTLNKGTSSTVFTGLEDKTVDIPDAYTKTESDNKYVAKSGYVAYSDAEKTKLAALDSTLYEKIASRKTSLDTVDNSTYPTTSAVKTYIDTNFVKKDGSKVLSTNDYTAVEKSKLAGLDASLYEKVANKITTLETVSESTYPSSKAVKDYIDGKGYNSGKIYKYIYDIDFDLQSADHTKALQGKLTLYLDSKDTTIGNALTGTSAVTWLTNYINTNTSVDSKIYGAFLFGSSGTSYIVSAIYNFGGEIYCYSPATIEGSTISADTATSVVSINYRGYTLN